MDCITTKCVQFVSWDFFSSFSIALAIGMCDRMRRNCRNESRHSESIRIIILALRSWRKLNNIYRSQQSTRVSQNNKKKSLYVASNVWMCVEMKNVQRNKIENQLQTGAGFCLGNNENKTWYNHFACIIIAAHYLES